MRAARIELSPLTSEERQFAELNHHLVEQFLYWNRLDPDDWYDVVIFRYLQAVKRWMMRPDLHIYKFATTLKYSLSSAVLAEKKKRSRRVQTVSLEEVIPGSDDMTYADIVTAGCLDYINYGEYDKSIKKKNTRKPKQPDVFAVEDFLKDGRRRDLQITYDTKEEAIARSKALYGYRKNHRLQEKIRISREGKVIAVLKIEGGKK